MTARTAPSRSRSNPAISAARTSSRAPSRFSHDQDLHESGKHAARRDRAHRQKSLRSRLRGGHGGQHQRAARRRLAHHAHRRVSRRSRSRAHRQGERGGRMGGRRQAVQDARAAPRRLRPSARHARGRAHAFDAPRRAHARGRLARGRCAAADHAVLRDEGRPRSADSLLPPGRPAGGRARARARGQRARRAARTARAGGMASQPARSVRDARRTRGNGTPRSDDAGAGQERRAARRGPDRRVAHDVRRTLVSGFGGAARHAIDETIPGGDHANRYRRSFAPRAPRAPCAPAGAGQAALAARAARHDALAHDPDAVRALYGELHRPDVALGRHAVDRA
ncbi:hypothetical protein PT2222_110191 [Paraburkholderia tropica]